MTDPRPQVLAFLDAVGAGAVPHHAGRSLRDHFIGTWRHLVAWGHKAAVAEAGLCHALYGTHGFAPVTLDLAARDRVRAAIGAEAERLVYLFGTLDRDRFLAPGAGGSVRSRLDGTVTPVSAADETALADILLANELDLVEAKKGPGRPDKVAKKVGPVFAALAGRLSPSARDAYRHLAGEA